MGVGSLLRCVAVGRETHWTLEWESVSYLTRSALSDDMAIFLQDTRATGISKVLVKGAASLRYRTVRSHRLLILSCYIHLEAIKQVIKELNNEVNLVEVELAFEFKEAFRTHLPTRCTPTS